MTSDTPTAQTGQLLKHVENPKHGFLTDIPLGVDRFGRATFSRAISTALVLPPKSEGLVVGIEGPWGSGKTFVINQVKAILLEHAANPIVVEFNPWVISGTDSLIEALLEQLCSAFGKESDPARQKAALKAGSSVLRYLSLVRHLKYLKYVPGATALGHAAEDLPDLAEKIGKSTGQASDDLARLEKAIPEHSLEARKTVAVNALSELGRPIVVILDDLDRLPPDEIRSVFQAVKAVANFPRTSYLLSYDPTIAARALDRRTTIGLSYLEKIVQVQYPLPSPLPWRMRAHVLEKLKETLTETTRNLTPDEESRLDETASYAARLCRHPRDVTRICNRLRISLPSTIDEVDANDVILLETIAVCERQIDEAIRQWPEDFTEPARVEFEKFGQEFYFAQAAERVGKGDESSTRERAWKKRIKGPLSVYAEGALRHLFPDSNQSPGTLRVQNWDRLYRFLALGPSEHITEIQDLQKLLQDNRTFRAAIDADDKSALSILRAMELYAGELQVADARSVVEVLCLSANRRLEQCEGDWGDLGSQYADVVETLVRRKSEDSAELMMVAIDTSPLSVSQSLMTKAASELGLWSEGDSTPEPEDKRLIADEPTYRSLLARWTKRVGDQFKSGVDLKREPSIYAVLYRYGQLGGDYKLPRKIAKNSC